MNSWYSVHFRRLLFVALISAPCWCVASATAQDGPAPPAREWKLVGVGSCTAAGCHGGGRPERIVGSEYNVWIAHDPHARAYSTLFDDRSRRIVELLSTAHDGPAVPAHQDRRCLACHSMTDREPRDPRRDVVSDGVGCEACHGPAEGWLAAHFEPTFATVDHDRVGFWNTDSLRVRTQICARCHVGGEERDVDHDLIAAGHPRLQFEMGAYHEALPKHWNESEDRQGREADFDSLLWALGQACTSQAALEQLARRADSDGPSTVWPEFAEWSCSACHHDLRLDAPRPSSVRGQGPPGRLIEWDTWNHFVPHAHAQEVSAALRLNTESASLIENALTDLAAEMQKLYPDRQFVAGRARATATELGRWAAAIETSRLDPTEIDPLAQAILATQLDRDSADWDSAAQTYNALASLHQARLSHLPAGTPANEALTAAIRNLYNDLAAHRRSPREKHFRPEELEQRMRDIRNQLAPPGDGR